MVETILRVDGMMCGMCESHINDVVRKTARVNKVTSSHTKGETVIGAEGCHCRNGLHRDWRADPAL